MEREAPPLHRQWYRVVESGVVESLGSGRAAMQGVQSRFRISRRDARIIDGRFIQSSQRRSPARVLVRERFMIFAIESLYLVIGESEVIIAVSNDRAMKVFLPKLQARLERRRALGHSSNGYLNVELKPVDSAGSSPVQTGAGSLTDGSKGLLGSSLGDRMGSARGKRSLWPGLKGAASSGEGAEVEEEDDLDLTLPFELLALEVALSVVTNRMEMSVETLERETLQVLDKFSRKASKDNLERLRVVKDKQSRLEYRLEGVREELQRFLDDDEDMVKMVLSRQHPPAAPEEPQARSETEFEVSGRGSATEDGAAPLDDSSERQPRLRTSGHQDFTVGEQMELDMVEELLEHYYATLDHCYDRAKAMEDFIANSERVINIGLDTARNSLIRLELVLTASTFSLTLWEVVGAVLGENVEIPHFMGENSPAFWYINGATLMVCVLVFLLIVGYCRNERLL